MENAADALKIAFGVLIFIVALSICIISFGQIRETAQFILNSKDNDYQNEYVEEVKDAEGNPVRKRIVGSETIIPSIYRAFEEKYRVIIKFLDDNDYIYHSYRGTNIPDELKFSYIDLAHDYVTISEEDEQRELFLNYILYGKNKEQVRNIFNIELKNDEPLFNKIKGKKFEESLGEYYIDDVKTEDQVTEPGEDTEDTVVITDNNKTKKRVITYREVAD